MKKTNWLLSSIVFCTLASLTTPAATLHVWQGSPSNAPPYTNWATAAHTIQDAVDAAHAGDTVLVTNGVYGTGGRVVDGAMTNRVAIDKAVRVASVNGPAGTWIMGWQPPGMLGDGAVRCVYMTNGAVLMGFTLTNGSTRLAGDQDREQSGGGVWCESTAAVVSNCVVSGNCASQKGGGIKSGTVHGCILTNNFARYYGGGVYGAELNYCAIISNTATAGGASSGGGAASSLLNHCALAGNLAESGGGAADCTLGFCVLNGNRADRGDREGGGARDSSLNYCTLHGNSAWAGGGADQCELDHCVLTDNSAEGAGFGGREGGGARYSSLRNCTVVGNDASDEAGGVYACDVVNSILWFNSAPSGANYAASVYFPMSVRYCCTTPLPTNGVGNITNSTGNISGEPLFIDDDVNLRLQPNSPCINAGNNAYVTNTTSDLDGNPRIVSGTVDMGAYEYQGTGSVISYAWLQQYGLPTDGSADDADPDGDGMSNRQEHLAATHPLDAQDNLRILSFTRGSSTPSYTILRWTSKPTRMYAIQRRSALNPVSPWQDLYTMPVLGTDNAGFDQFGGPYFYRIRAFQP